jgi:hypothetical protein
MSEDGAEMQTDIERVDENPKKDLIPDQPATEEKNLPDMNKGAEEDVMEEVTTSPKKRKPAKVEAEDEMEDDDAPEGGSYWNVTDGQKRFISAPRICYRCVWFDDANAKRSLAFAPMMTCA